jgi:hypothetical protein
VRASATSKAASPANYFASQAKADANKVEGDSPFALLVASIAPRDAAKDLSRQPVKDATQSNDKPGEDQAGLAQDTLAADATAESGAIAPQPSKPEKSGKTKEDVTAKTDKVEAGPDDVALPAPFPEQDMTAPQPQILPLPAPAAAPESDDEQELPVTASVPVDQAGPRPALQALLPSDVKPSDFKASDVKPSDIAPSDSKEKLQATNRSGDQVQAPAPEIDQRKPEVTARVANPVALPSVPDQAEEDENAGTQATEPAPATASVAPEVAAGPSTDTSGPQVPAVTEPPAAKIAEAPNVSAQSEHAKSRASATGVEHAAPQSAAAKTTLSNPGLTETAAKAGTPKTRSPQADAGSESKVDTEKGDAPKVALQPALQEHVATPKAAPQPAPNAIDAINSIAAPQAQSSPIAAATVNQHIQVTAHAAPDLPALAVEIAAKSQSGAKQFDIRLDPPELGRVEVRLSIDATGKASAHLSADQPQTLSQLQKDAPILARALRDAGLDVSQNGLNFSLRQQGENSSGNAGNNGRRPRSFPLSASLTIDASAGSAAYRGPANGRLDIRV